jgi:hypothetical protein
MSSFINFDDIRPDLFEQIHQNVEIFSIILLLEGEICGSGTLVKVDSVPGILTAAHVVEYIEKEAKKHATPNLGTILERRLSLPIQEPLTHFQWFSTLRKEKEWGPDLALIRIPRPSRLFSSLETKKSFWDLTRDDIASTSARFTKKTPTASFGIVAEKTHIVGNLVQLNACTFVGGSPKKIFHEDYDYIDSLSRRSLQPEMPSSFGGVSGAGLWTFGVERHSNAKFKPTNFLLAGVAFYENPNLAANPDPDLVAIRHHGPKSLYENFRPKIREWLKANS